MADVYVKRHTVVSAEAFDPARADQGVTVNRDASGSMLSATMLSRGRVVSVRPGDMLVTDDAGAWPTSEASFSALYDLLSDVVMPDAGAISETGGNQ